MVISLVLITFPNEIEFDNTFSLINKLLKKNSRLIIADTHPCFRTKKFSTFFTNLKNKTFNYFKNHMPFQVSLLTKSTKEIKFQDFHYNFDFLFQKLNEHKFLVENLKELKDQKINGVKFYNRNYSPYFILKSIKNDNSL